MAAAELDDLVVWCDLVVSVHCPGGKARYEVVLESTHSAVERIVLSDDESRAVFGLQQREVYVLFESVPSKSSHHTSENPLDYIDTHV